MVNPMYLSLYQRMKEIVVSPSLFIVLSFLYPAAYLLQVNYHIFNADQIIVTIIFVLLVSVVTALICSISVRYFLKVTLTVINKSGLKMDIIRAYSKLYQAFHGGIGTIIHLVLLFSMYRDFIFQVGSYVVVVWSITTLGITLLTYRLGFRFVNFTLCSLILFNCALAISESFWGKSLNGGTPKMQRELVFKQKPNVYFVILESYTSLDIRGKIFGIDNEPLIQELNQKNYDTYKTYVSYCQSLPSMASIFLMDHHYYKSSRGMADGRKYRAIIGGLIDNPVINTFLKNGYRIDYSDFTLSLYTPSAVVNAEEFQPLLQPIEIFDGLFMLSDRMLSYSFWGSEFFQSLLWLPEKITKIFQKPVAKGKIKKDGRPTFYFSRAGANHTEYHHSDYPPEIKHRPNYRKMKLWQLNHLNNYWTDKYKLLVAKSDTALIEFIRGVAEKDPEAIVILMGDHGTWLNRLRWTGGKSDPNENMIENGIQPAEVTRDLFEVFLAIKWPQGAKKPLEYFSSVNLFHQVFAVLTEDTSIHKSMVSNDSFIHADVREDTSLIRNRSLYRTVKSGKILERWEPFTIPAAQ